MISSLAGDKGARRRWHLWFIINQEQGTCFGKEEGGGWRLQTRWEMHQRLQKGSRPQGMQRQRAHPLQNFHSAYKSHQRHGQTHVQRCRMLAEDGRQQYGLDFHYRIPKTWHFAHFGYCSEPRAQLQAQAFAVNIWDGSCLGPAESNGRFATAHQRSTTSNTEKKSHLPSLKLSFNKASLQAGNKQRKFCLFLTLLELGKERQMQKRVFFSHPHVQKDIPHVVLGTHLHHLTAIAWGALPSTSTMVYHSKLCSLT